MYFVRSLDRWGEDPKPFEDQDDAEMFATNESWSEDAYGIWEGDTFESAELTTVAFSQQLFYK